MSSLRLFVGLGISDEVAAGLVGLGGGIPGARWLARDNLHVTLRFIGEVDGAQARDIDAALSGIKSPGFTLGFEGIGTFGERRRTRMLWVGVRPEPLLLHLRAKVESALVRAGLEPEGRRFHPHVTIARLNDPQMPRLRAFIENNGAFRAGPMGVGAFNLYRSHLGHEGAHYERLAEYRLGVWNEGG